MKYMHKDAVFGAIFDGFTAAIYASLFNFFSVLIDFLFSPDY